MYAVLLRDDFYVNQCVFQLHPDKLQYLSHSETPMEIFGTLKNLAKNIVSPIVKFFVCQSVKKDFNIDNFIAEQDLKTLPRLYGDKCDEYSSDVSE